MKTAYLLSACGLGALLMASCSSDEPISTNVVNDNSISFRPAVTSRGAETTNANLNEIYVNAFMNDSIYFPSTLFSKGADNYFSATPNKRWPGDESTLQFFAYAPSQDALGADITVTEGATPNLTLESFTVADSIADQVDFVTASASGTRTANETTGVPLDFKHRLAQIEIRAKSENPDYTFEVAGARIGRAEYIGSFDFAKEEWTLDDWHDTNVWSTECTPFTLTATPQSLMGNAGNAMMIPQQLTPWDPTGDPDNVAREAYLSVKVRITNTDGVCVFPFPAHKAEYRGARYGWASIPVNQKWEQGTKYIYVLDFTEGAGNTDPDDPQPGTPVLGGPIKFTVNVEKWSENTIPVPMTPVLK